MLPETFAGKRGALHSLRTGLDPKISFLGYDVRTEGELEEALNKTCNEKSFSLIEVHTDKWDATPALKVAGDEMRKKNQA